ncbi:hypothetical protein ACWDSJ_15100 [Nocardia sp. NPDC003482]
MPPVGMVSAAQQLPAPGQPAAQGQPPAPQGPALDEDNLELPGAPGQPPAPQGPALEGTTWIFPGRRAAARALGSGMTPGPRRRSVMGLG